MLIHKNLIGVLGCLLVLGLSMEANAWDPFSDIKEAVNAVKEKLKTDTDEDRASNSTDISSLEKSSITTVEKIPDGSDMAELQSLLNELDTHGESNVGQPDGIYGNRTRRAIQVFQQQQGIAVDGVASYAILDRARIAARGLPQEPASLSHDADGRAAPVEIPDFILSQCIETDVLYGDQLMDGIFKEMTENLPIDVRPYLVGFCLPEDTYYLERIYLYLVAQGAAHARLTLLKYDALVDYYGKAGVDLGIRKDAFKRAIESLDSDIRTWGKNRRGGAKKLLGNFEAEPVQHLLKALPQGYEQLETRYREGARELMAEALAHSISSTFYLSRSTLTAREFFGMHKFDSVSGSGFWQSVKKKIGKVTQGVSVAYFATDHKDELIDMTKASTYAVKIFTVDIKEVPRIDPAKVERELAQYRERNSVELDEFELAFENQQLKQLNNMDV